jgi:hypothetical protein
MVKPFSVIYKRPATFNWCCNLSSFMKLNFIEFLICKEVTNSQAGEVICSAIKDA